MGPFSGGQGSSISPLSTCDHESTVVELTSAKLEDKKMKYTYFFTLGLVLFSLSLGNAQQGRGGGTARAASQGTRPIGAGKTKAAAGTANRMAVVPGGTGSTGAVGGTANGAAVGAGGTGSAGAGASGVVVGAGRMGRAGVAVGAPNHSSTPGATGHPKSR
jgi:hypothetical protein